MPVVETAGPNRRLVLDYPEHCGEVTSRFKLLSRMTGSDSLETQVGHQARSAFAHDRSIRSTNGRWVEFLQQPVYRNVQSRGQCRGPARRRVG